MTALVDERLRKWSDFMDVRSAERTIILVNFNKDSLGPRPWPYPGMMREREEWATAYYHLMEAQASWLDDDRVPFISPYTGTEIFAEAFGCRVHYSGDNMPFALPMCKSVEEVAKLRVPDVHSTPLSNLFELARRIRQRTDAQAPVQLPDIQSPLDIAALVFEKSEFLIAMLEEPEAVHELIAKTRQLLTAFLDEWFREFGSEYIAHFPEYYMRGGFTFSEDEVGEFSDSMFREFCLGPINALSDRYGGCGMHCCADSQHQWAGFRDIEGLRLLNLAQEPEILDTAGEFFGPSVCHWHMYGIAGRPGKDTLVPEWVGRCPPDAHVIIERDAATRDDAEDLCRQLREVEAARAEE